MFSYNLCSINFIGEVSALEDDAEKLKLFSDVNNLEKGKLTELELREQQQICNSAGVCRYCGSEFKELFSKSIQNVK